MIDLRALALVGCIITTSLLAGSATAVVATVPAAFTAHLAYHAAHILSEESRQMFDRQFPRV